MLLKDELSRVSQYIRAQIGVDILAAMDKATADFKAQGLAGKGAKVGDAFPSARLFNAHGNEVVLEELLQQGPLAVTFYRGGWCPYCSLELKAYQAVLSEIKASGGQLVAITPEPSTNTLAISQQNELSFDILTDKGNELAKQLGILISLPEALQKLYGGTQVDWKIYSVNSRIALPIPATFVVGQDGIIIYRFVDEDYTKRAEPKDVLDILWKGTG